MLWVIVEQALVRKSPILILILIIITSRCINIYIYKYIYIILFCNKSHFIECSTPQALADYFVIVRCTVKCRFNTISFWQLSSEKKCLPISIVIIKSDFFFQSFLYFFLVSCILSLDFISFHVICVMTFGFDISFVNFTSSIN